MRPNSEELLRGIQGSLLQYVLPEVQTEYARTQVMVIYALLGIAAGEWNGATERLAADNGALRELASRAAAQTDDTLAQELRELASEELPLRPAELASANARLGLALARVEAAAAGEPRPGELRASIIELLRADAEARSLSLMGPRADG